MTNTATVSDKSLLAQLLYNNKMKVFAKDNSTFDMFSNKDWKFSTLEKVGTSKNEKGETYDIYDTKDADCASDADLLHSEVKGGLSQHMGLFDLDIPHLYFPSTTLGHGHLVITKPTSWVKYVAVLKAMVDAGWIEEGYYKASLSKGFAAVRLPWVKKSAEEIAGKIKKNGYGQEVKKAQPETKTWDDSPIELPTEGGWNITGTPLNTTDFMMQKALVGAYGSPLLSWSAESKHGLTAVVTTQGQYIRWMEDGTVCNNSSLIAAGHAMNLGYPMHVSALLTSGQEWKPLTTPDGRTWPGIPVSKNCSVSFKNATLTEFAQVYIYYPKSTYSMTWTLNDKYAVVGGKKPATLYIHFPAAVGKNEIFIPTEFKKSFSYTDGKKTPWAGAKPVDFGNFPKPEDSPKDPTPYGDLWKDCGLDEGFSKLKATADKDFETPILAYTNSDHSTTIMCSSNGVVQKWKNFTKYAVELTASSPSYNSEGLKMEVAFKLTKGDKWSPYQSNDGKYVWNWIPVTENCEISEKSSDTPFADGKIKYLKIFYSKSKITAIWILDEGYASINGASPKFNKLHIPYITTTSSTGNGSTYKKVAEYKDGKKTSYFGASIDASKLKVDASTILAKDLYISKVDPETVKPKKKFDIVESEINSLSSDALYMTAVKKGNKNLLYYIPGSGYFSVMWSPEGEAVSASHGVSFPWSIYQSMGLTKEGPLKGQTAEKTTHFGFSFVDTSNLAGVEVPSFLKKKIDEDDSNDTIYIAATKDDKTKLTYFVPSINGEDVEWEVYDSFYEHVATLSKVPTFVLYQLNYIYKKAAKKSPAKSVKKVPLKEPKKVSGWIDGGSVIFLDKEGKAKPFTAGAGVNWKKIGTIDDGIGITKNTSSSAVTPNKESHLTPGLPIPTGVMKLINHLQDSVSYHLVGVEYGQWIDKKKDGSHKSGNVGYIVTYETSGHIYAKLVDKNGAHQNVKDLGEQAKADATSLAKFDNFQINYRLYFKHPEWKIPAYVTYDDYSTVLKGTWNGKTAYWVIYGIGDLISPSKVYSGGKVVWNSKDELTLNQFVKVSGGLAFHSTFTL